MRGKCGEIIAVRGNPPQLKRCKNIEFLHILIEASFCHKSLPQLICGEMRGNAGNPAAITAIAIIKLPQLPQFHKYN